MKKSKGGGAKVSRYVFVVLAWLILGCVILQTFLAGMSVFTDPSHWKDHTIFVHLFEYLPLLMLILAFTGRLPNTLCWKSAAIFALIFAQYFTANVPGAGAVHPVLALVMFWLTISVARESTRHIRR